jgi:hypothetical protein
MTEEWRTYVRNIISREERAEVEYEKIWDRMKDKEGQSLLV